MAFARFGSRQAACSRQPQRNQHCSGSVRLSVLSCPFYVPTPRETQRKPGIHNQLPGSDANGTCYNANFSAGATPDTRCKGNCARGSETDCCCSEAETRQAVWDEADHRG